MGHGQFVDASQAHESECVAILTSCRPSEDPDQSDHDHRFEPETGQKLVALFRPGQDRKYVMI